MIMPASASPSVLEVTGEVATILATVLAVAAVSLTFTAVARQWLRRSIGRVRSIEIGRTLRTLGLVDRRTASRWAYSILGRSARDRVAEEGELHRDVTQELESLVDILSPARRGRPFLVARTDDGAFDLRQARAIRDAYARCAARLQHRMIFGSASNPVIVAEIELVTRVIEVLSTYVDGVLDTAMPLSSAPPAGRRLDYPSFSASVLDLGVSASDQGDSAHDIVVTYRDRFAPGPASLAGELSPMTGREYDGHLPWLTDVRSEVDQNNGRPRLHLSFEKTTFRQFRAENDRRMRLVDDGRAPARLPDEGLLTLSFLPVVRDGRLLIVRRNAGLAHRPSAYSSYVTGNLDLKSRRYISADLDDRGLPSPQLAMRREIAEEVGLSLPVEAVHAIGLSQIWARNDCGTWVLSFSATLDESAQETVRRIRHADPVEGSWEVGREATAIDLPETAAGVAEIVHYFASQANVVAPLPANLLAVATVRGFDAQEIIDAVTALQASAKKPKVSKYLESIPVVAPFGR